MFFWGGVCDFLHFVFRGWVKKVLPLSFLGTKSDDNVEHMQPLDDFMHLKYLVLEKVMQVSLSWVNPDHCSNSEDSVFTSHGTKREIVF